MVFFSAQEESEPDAIHAPICVIFNTHTQKGIKKKIANKKKNTQKKHGALSSSFSLLSHF